MQAADGWPMPEIPPRRYPLVPSSRSVRIGALLFLLAMLLILTASVFILGGCSATLTPTQRLTLAENAFNTGQETATILHRSGAIPKQDDAAIVAADHAARAAINAAYGHQTDTTFETAVAAAEAAVQSFAATVAQAKASTPAPITTQPAK